MNEILKIQTRYKYEIQIFQTPYLILTDIIVIALMYMYVDESDNVIKTLSI